MRKPVFGVSDQGDTNRSAQSTEYSERLVISIWEEEGLYFLSSENKDADQLRGCYREADLRLCFRICKNPGFLTVAAHMWASNLYSNIES